MENIILLINFLVMIAFNMAHPVTPMMIQTLGLPDYMFGVFFSMMAISNFVMSPIWGKWSDQAGRKRYLAIGTILYGLSQFGFGLSTQVLPILFFRALGGIGAACFSIVMIATVSDVSSPEKRARNFAWYMATYSLGAGIGSILGGYIGQQNGYIASFVTQGIYSIILGIIIFITLKETNTNPREQKTLYLEHLKFTKSSISLKGDIGVTIIVMALISLTTTAYNSSINFYIEAVLGLSSTLNGTVTATSAVIALFMNILITPYLAKKFSVYKSIKVITLIAGVSLVIGGATTSPVIAGILIFAFVSSSSMIVPMQQTIVTKIAAENYGEVMGIQGSAKALGMIIGSLGAGFIFMIDPELPFIFAGISAILAFYFLTRLKES
ncbi:hypothetical protein AN639_07685 [Candidatus Epulonipiscium fishelsonii]|uniref:Uncharacterized protein n=1 Tax=Candidatus Epulonipiscium fishelsonii TaxID=77094 RepID=A0ACC8XBI6_9FIRM|nr:hypothetical protein AN639_07685 [Epulopiscium sp. SCG-B05WGA-EpuloA1]ONI39788.1 hypothetical protein AN396_06955 [Epulopiscium sp. SCG-B11WGA-EpuloA1]